MAACDILIHVALVTALLRTDYTTMIVVNSCSLLSVVLVAAFCSGVKEQQGEGAELAEGQNMAIRSDKIGPEKIWTCLIVVVGIIIFSLAGQKEASKTETVVGGAFVTFLLFAGAISL